MPFLMLEASALLASGLACGLLLPPAWLPAAPPIVTAALVTALLAHANARPMSCHIASGAAAFGLAAIYGAHALDAALHTPLRTALEERFGGFAIESERRTRLEEPIGIEGRLEQDAIRTGSGVILRLRADRIRLGMDTLATRGAVSLGVSGTLAADRADAWTRGRRIRAPAFLRRPAVYRDAGVPDRERALARLGTTLAGSVKSGALVEVIELGSLLDEAAARVRNRVRRAMAQWLAPRDPIAAAVALAILIGDRAALDADVERRLQEAGTYHVVAISGGNVAVFAGLVLGTLALAGCRGRGAALAGIVTILAYGTIAEGGASVTRATAIAVIYLVVRLLDLRTPPTQALAIAATGMLLLDPLSVADVGFWLTFGASVAIVLGAGRVALPSARWLALPLSILAASIAVETVLLPIAALVFERVTVAGLGLNFVAIPSMSLVQVASMALVAGDVLGSGVLASSAAQLVQWGAEGLIESASLVDAARGVAWRVPAPPAGVTAAYYLSLACWWWWSARTGRLALVVRWGRLAGRMALLWGVAIAISPQTLRAPRDGRLHLRFFDVGQGDATLVVFPDGRTLMVDAGGSGNAFDVGDRVLGPALRAHGIRRLDYLAVTHGDPDHIGGAASLVRDFAPREIWMGVPVANHAPTEALREEARRVRAAWRTLRRGDAVEIGGAAIDVLHPPPPDWERQRVRNDDSLVLEIRFNDLAIVLAGDIGRAVEHELLSRLTHRPLTILKVPHHGSATSSSEAFLAALRPAFALVGVGRGNIYGHPVQAVMERYARIGARVLRTDLDGEIDISSDGYAIEVASFAGER